MLCRQGWGQARRVPATHVGARGEPERRAFQSVVVREPGDAVMSERSFEKPQEFVGDAGAACAHAPQVTAELCLVRGTDLARRRRPRHAREQPLDVGEYGELVAK